MNLQAPNGPRSFRFTWSRSHWMHSAFAVVAIGLYILAGISHTRVSSLPPDFPLDQLNYPVMVGQYTAHSEPELLARIAGEPVGHPLMLRSVGGLTETRVITQKLYTSFHDMIIKINGLFFLAVSLIVFAPRIDKVPARDLFWACLFYGLAITIGGVHQPQGQVWPGVLIPFTRILSLVILPILMFHVGCSFPKRVWILVRFPRIIPVLVFIGLVVAGWQFWAWGRWFSELGAWESTELPSRAGAIFLAMFVGTGCVGMIFGYRRTVQKREREQVKWLLWGISMGSAPFVFLHSLPLALGLEPLLPLEVARLFSIVIPIAMSFVVIRHKFLDVDIIIRRSLLYVLLASMMVGIYAVIGIFVGQRVEERWPQTGPFVPIVATIVAATLFSPTRQGFARLIDRVFFQIRYNHAQALTTFRKELREVVNQQDVSDILRAFLLKHLGPSVGDVIFQHNGPTMFPTDVRLIALPGSTARHDIETDKFPASWQSSKYVLAHAIEAEGNRFGYLILGEKSNGRSYVVEDLDLLAAATRETAIRVNHMNLKQDFVDEVVARHHVEEMNSFRTQFFAQIAHDIRSPLTSINWAARNLLDGVVGEVSPPQVTYLEGIETSARQLVRLVNNLLEATRLESGLPEVEFSQMNLTATVDDSVFKLKATAEAKKVRLVVQSPEEISVFGNQEKLLEVIDNLIENAIRYAPEKTQVDVRIFSNNDSVHFVVEDQGPGLDAKDLDVIFEPYRQGTPSPHSPQQGFGLGLFVVRSWVERMGGRVHAENRQSGGARFTISLLARELKVLEETE